MRSRAPWRLSAVVATAMMLAILAPADARADTGNPLLAELGRNESRILSEPFPIVPGGTVLGYGLAERLERQGYVRTRGRRPSAPGEFFWGNEVFWLFLRAHRSDGKRRAARLVALDLGAGGRVLGLRAADGDPLDSVRLEPEVLAESLDERRAQRVPIRLDALPELVWRPVLAAEDARFFEHPGVDGRSVARALLANARAGGVAQGGSTITQQLIKNRDLTPKRSLGRKASEALRALALEARVDKRDILEAYLDQVYLGHVDGLAIHGLGTAARVYFSKSAERLTLAEAALIAGMIQAPNRRTPTRHAQAARARRDWALSRMEDLGWASAADVAKARAQPVRARPSAPERPPAAEFRAWIAADVAAEAVAIDRGYVVQSRLDPLLQQRAGAAVRAHLKDLRRRHPRLRNAPLSAALVTLESYTGAVLAHVGGDPAGDVGFDRARSARRQPGSAIKPLLLLEAFDDCGARPALFPAARVADAPLEIALPTGSWKPSNDDDRFRGPVTLRRALVESLNVPFVRLARHCGLRTSARSLRAAGLDIPSPPPPSFALGAVETSPLRLAAAYSALANAGDASEPWAWSRIEESDGSLVRRRRTRETHVADRGAAFLVRDVLRDAVAEGTARGAAIEGIDVAAKTGTSSDRRDAWLAGTAGSLVTVVWVGRDDGRPLGLSGGLAAAPLWRTFMETAVAARPPHSIERPPTVVERWIDPKTGLLVRSFSPGAQSELFLRGRLPPRDRFWRTDEPVEVLR
ncbi:MAG: transglycosylase domain-containing protein [Acidobacteriota bacterium]